MDRLFCDLEGATAKEKRESVHLTDFPKADGNQIDKDLEEQMQVAQNISSMVLSLRKKEGIKVRQPLGKIMVPVSNEKFRAQLKSVEQLILSEVNVKHLEYLEDSTSVIVKKIKPNFKTLGPKYGKMMKKIVEQFGNLKPEDIETIEKGSAYETTIEGQKVKIGLEDVEISSEDIKGWLVSNVGGLTVALDIEITQELKEEGLARDLVNKIQNLRKENKFEVTDKITIQIKSDDKINAAINNNLNYICTETLASTLEIIPEIGNGKAINIALNEEITAVIALKKED
jgi:isoleucyl-tRNA synthetase